MVEVYDSRVTGRFALPLRMHNLLLAFAGRLDDSGLNEIRELTARARLDEAAELTAGILIAGRLPVRAAEQRELALLLELSRSDATLADQLTVSDDSSAIEVAHRFSGEERPERGLSAALSRPLNVLPDLRSVHAVWRNTPAGAVGGPLPQRVVLVEVGPNGSPPATAHRLETALRRADIPAAVEVIGTQTARCAYHEQAHAVAVLVWQSGADGARAIEASAADVSAPEPARSGVEAREAAADVSAPAVFAPEVAPAQPPSAQRPDEHVPPAAPPADAAPPEREAATSPAANPEPAPVQVVQRAAEQEPADPAYPAEPAMAEAEPPDTFQPQPPTATSVAPLSTSSAEKTSVFAPEPPAAASESDQRTVAPGAHAAAELEQVEAADVEPLAPGEMFRPLTDPPHLDYPSAASRSEHTADLSAEVAKVRASAFKDAEPATSSTAGELDTSAAPSGSLDDPRLSERDRALLRELHAELAKREREEASKVPLNGRDHGDDPPPWARFGRA